MLNNPIFHRNNLFVVLALCAILIFLSACSLFEQPQSGPTEQAVPGGALVTLTPIPTPTLSAIVAPEPETITLSVGAALVERVVELPAGSQAEYLFEANAGELLFASTTLGSILSLVSLDGTPITVDAVTNLSVTLPGTQMYKLIVNATEQGKFQVRIGKTTPPAGAAIPLTVAEGGIVFRPENSLQAGTSVSYSFDATAEQVMSVAVLGASEGYVVSLVGSDNTVLLPAATLMSRWSGDVPVSQNYVMTLHALVTEPIMVQVVVDQVTVESEPVQLSIEALSFGLVRTGYVETFENVDQFQFEAQAGQLLQLTVRSDNNGAFFSLLGEDGVSLIPAGFSGLSHWIGALPTTQTYTVRISTRDAYSSYSLEMSIPELPAVQPVDVTSGSATVDGQLSAGGTVEYSMSLEAGHAIQIDVPSSSVPVALWVSGPAGQFVEPNESLSRVTFVAPETGEYRILLSAPLAGGETVFSLAINVDG